MKILMLVKYPPIQGGVSIQNYWLAQTFVELGHEVVILTNADEVEDEYRIFINNEDRALLTGYRKNNSIRIISTYHDKREVFIPQTRPFGTKLVSIGLEIIKDWRPDFLYAHYVEPYGIAALHLSKLTGVPYVIKHAGSDLGKLGLLPQMRTLHEKVYCEAMFVITKYEHHRRFVRMGVATENLTTLRFRPWPPDVFYPTDMPTIDSMLQLLIYGKTGPSKGTLELIESMRKVRDKAHLTAYWGGRLFGQYRAKLDAFGLVTDGTVSLSPYVPHWRIADAIRSAHAVLYLENNFSIPIHTPGVPFEIIACGRLLITTEEIAKKYPDIITDVNSIIIPGTPLQTGALVTALTEAGKRVRNGCGYDTCIDTIKLFAQGVNNVEQFLWKISQRF